MNHRSDCIFKIFIARNLKCVLARGKKQSLRFGCIISCIPYLVVILNAVRMNHFKMLSRMRIQQIRFFCKQLSPIQSPVITEVSSFELNDYDSFLKPTFNFAAYIDKSLTLQQFAKLGKYNFLEEIQPSESDFELFKVLFIIF